MLTRENHLRVHFDRQRLGQLMVILIENAVRYSPKGSNVNISLHETTDELEVRVVNEATDFDEISFGRLIERHYRSPSAKRIRPDGLGVGLSIANVLVKAHGGELQFSGDDKKRFCVSFRLKLKGPENEDFNS